MNTEEFPNFEKSGKTELGRRGRAIGIQGLHVDNEGRLGLALRFHKSFSIGETRVQSHKACGEKCVKHGLYQRAVRSFLRRCSGVCKEEPTRCGGVPYVRGDRHRPSWTDAFCCK